MLHFGTIGCGHMASAILESVFRHYEEPVSLYTYDIFPEGAKALAGRISLTVCESVKELVSCCEYILIAVKPQQYPDVLKELATLQAKDKVYLSIGAGIGSAYLKKELGFDAKLVMLMPNTPLQLGFGATGAAAVTPVTEKEYQTAVSFFSCGGIVVPVMEEDLFPVISLSGSSPAFIYAFAKGFIDYGKEAGLSEEAATALFCQALRGAAEMMEKSKTPLTTLIDQVATKGGTTEQGILALKEHKLEDAVKDACVRCERRAREMAK